MEMNPSSYIVYRSMGFFLLFVCSSFGPGFQEIPMVSFFNLVLLLTLVHTTKTTTTTKTTRIHSSSHRYCCCNFHQILDYLGFFLVFSMGEFIAYSQVLGSDSTSLLLTATLAIAFVLLVGVFCAIPLTYLPYRYPFFAIPSYYSSSSSSAAVSPLQDESPRKHVVVGLGGLYIFPISFTAVWFIITHIFPTGAWGTFAYIGLHQSSSYIRLLSIYFGIDGIHFWLGWAASLVFCFVVIPIWNVIILKNKQQQQQEQQEQQHDFTVPNDTGTTAVNTTTHLLPSKDGKATYYKRVLLKMNSSSSSSNMTVDDLYLHEETESLPTLDEHDNINHSMNALSLPSSSPQQYDTIMVMKNIQQQQEQEPSVSTMDTSVSFPHGIQHILIFLIVSFFLFLYPNIRTITSYGQFYQRNIETWNQESVRAVCLAGYGSMVSIQDRLAQTQNISQQALFLSPNELHPQTAQLILWSEESWYVNTLEEENYIFQQVGAIAHNSKVTIGIGYRAPLTSNSTIYSYRNMFILVNTQGQIDLKYQKVHPVPGIEDNIEPGIHRPPLVSMESIPGVTLGAAICFDFDFPTFIQKTTRKHFSSSESLIMLQPGWDWGPIGIVHARMVAQRAVENGFTLFRCSSGGVSGVYDAYGNVITETIMGTKLHDTLKSASSYTARIPILPRVRTPYSLLGDSFGIICFFLWVILMFLVMVRDSWIRRFGIITSILRPRSISFTIQ